MALTTTTALSYYQQESATISEWTNPITFSLDALSADDIEVCAIASTGPSGFQRTALVKGVDYTLDFAAKTVTCTSTNWSDLDAIQDATGSGGASYPPDRIRVFRSTGVGSLVDYTDGAVLNAADLNLSYKQSLFASQEMNEDAGFTRGGVQSVTTGTLGNLSVSSAKIQDNAVIASKIANNAVATANIQEDAVTDHSLATGSVLADQIATNAVTVNKLATDAVTTAKIANDAVTYDKVLPASKAQMEGQLGAGTHGTPGVVAGVVTPDVLKNSPLVPKCYGSVTYDGGSPSVAAGSYNVQSVANTSTSQRTITFSTALSNASYFVLVTGTSPSAISDFYATVIQKSTSGFVIDGGSLHEAANLNFDFVVFGSTY